MLAVCLIIKELTHKPISDWMTTLELQLKYFLGEVWDMVIWVLSISPTPRTALSLGPTAMHVVLNKTHGSWL